MKKKGVILHGGGARMLCHESPNVSGRGPGGYWVSQLPFMQKSGEKKPNVHFSPTGFSINGGHRSGRYIGKTSKFSKVVTPFKGTNAKGYGGTQGKYPISAVIQGTGSDVAGIQQLYMKPSSLATKTMLTKKLTWIYNSQYPNVWVQPTYPTGSLDKNASMGTYIEKLKSQNCTTVGSDNAVCVNACKKYGNFTKRVKGEALSYSQYLEYLDRKCLNPKGDEKPFPFNANNNRASSSSRRTVGFEAPIIYYKSPEWYKKTC